MPAQAVTRSADTPRLVAFGKYLLLDRIATGGMAEVWLGKTLQNGAVSDLLAIKRILSRHSNDEEFLRMFIDEARIAGQLAHPGIVPIHELGKVGGSLYISMEYVWGRDLLGILRRLRDLGRALDPATAAYIAARMCDALHYAHTARDRGGTPLHVVHRDVSPQNVLVSFDGKVKLIDFGIAKAATRSTKTQAGTLKGKVGYMSPEQVRGDPIDHRSDIFASGTCLYEMITGRPLFSRPNNFDAMELVREAEVPPLADVAPECPPRLAEIVMRALRKDPAERFATAHEMQKALTLFLAEHDPSFDRFTFVQWLRTIFRDELVDEKRRLDALDLIGRPAVAPVGKRKPNASTRLEIGAFDLFDDDEEIDTQILDLSPLAQLEIEVHPPGPYEVFFQRSESTSHPGGASSSNTAAALASPPRRVITDLGPYPRAPHDAAAEPLVLLPHATLPDASMPSVRIAGEVGAAAPAPEATPDITQKQQAIRDERDPEKWPDKSIADAANVELDPAEINSQVIRALLSTRNPARRAAAIEPTEALRTPRRRGSTRWSDLVLLVIGGSFMLVLGAAGTYAVLSAGATASIEVRTVPPIPAALDVDGTGHGRTPVRVDGLAPGRHVVTIRADGYQATTRTVHLAPRSTALLELPLLPEETAPIPP